MLTLDVIVIRLYQWYVHCIFHTIYNNHYKIYLQFIQLESNLVQNLGFYF